MCYCCVNNQLHLPLPSLLLWSEVRERKIYAQRCRHVLSQRVTCSTEQLNAALRKRNLFSWWWPRWAQRVTRNGERCSCISNRLQLNSFHCMCECSGLYLRLLRHHKWTPGITAWVSKNTQIAVEVRAWINNHSQNKTRGIITYTCPNPGAGLAPGLGHVHVIITLSLSREII